RPAIVHDWIKNARKWEGEFWKAPSVDKMFAGTWWTWWSNLQPEDRPRGDDGMFLRTDEELDWSGVNVTGKNGILSVMASLLWWGEACMWSEERDMSEWSAAVSDVAWALQEADR
ncbi:hypothetical protein BV25DRAFT_1782489, partial [Artomyces pyxidatus]